jgi:hypothetical protein
MRASPLHVHRQFRRDSHKSADILFALPYILDLIIRNDAGKLGIICIGGLVYAIA